MYILAVLDRNTDISRQAFYIMVYGKTLYNLKWSGQRFLQKDASELRGCGSDTWVALMGVGPNLAVAPYSRFANSLLNDSTTKLFHPFSWKPFTIRPNSSHCFSSIFAAFSKIFFAFSLIALGYFLLFEFPLLPFSFFPFCFFLFRVFLLSMRFTYLFCWDCLLKICVHCFWGKLFWLFQGFVLVVDDIHRGVFSKVSHYAILWNPFPRGSNGT